ncbi:hypothetical protein IFM89_014881 [Coptis chinensis]|uniref:FBD domain-containing protein n=1 Tax=Coptis chinensis TaxID=261450 RepID=A0A835HBT9_9MAGN|nr:hypothetical protein IFM89_014881 [Coptis chinensis]
MMLKSLSSTSIRLRTDHIYLLLAFFCPLFCCKILTDFPELSGRLPDFHNLRYMVLSDWFSGSYIHAAVNFLGRFPHIETLAWERLDQVEIDMNPETEEEYWIDNMPLQSIFDYVKIFEIGELRMCTDALSFLEVLLKRAIVLKKLIIKRVTRKRYGMDVEEFKRKLVELP